MMSVLRCYNLLYMACVFRVFVEFCQKVAVPVGFYASVAFLCVLNYRTMNHFSIQCLINRKIKGRSLLTSCGEKQTFCGVQHATNAI